MNRRSFIGLMTGLAVVPMLGRALAEPATNSLIDALDLNGAPGVVIAAVRAGRTLFIGGKGHQGSGDARSPHAGTVFEIGSLTKTFTASLIYELEREGRLDTTEPLKTYVSDLPAEWRTIRLENLLSHTSGLPEYLDANNFLELMPRDLAPRELIGVAAIKPIEFEPGTRHAYNNTGYILLGMVAEAVGGATYWDQLNLRFFRPAGMSRTGPRSQILAPSDFATGRFWDGSAWNDHPPISAPGSTFSAGGLVSTARDLARWAVALDTGVGVSGETLQQMWRPALLNHGASAGWGHGWGIEQVHGRTIVFHGGGTAGFSCWFRRDLNAKLTTIVLTNQNGRADPRAMTNHLLNQLGG